MHSRVPGQSERVDDVAACVPNAIRGDKLKGAQAKPENEFPVWEYKAMPEGGIKDERWIRRAMKSHE